MLLMISFEWQYIAVIMFRLSEHTCTSCGAFTMLTQTGLAGFIKSIFCVSCVLVVFHVFICQSSLCCMNTYPSLSQHSKVPCTEQRLVWSTVRFSARIACFFPSPGRDSYLSQGGFCHPDADHPDSKRLENANR